MARLARESFETQFFHVMVQGLDREAIFSETNLKDKYAFNLDFYKTEFHIKILAYCIMDNHCHLLLKVPNVNAMAKYMKKVNTTFAQYYNYCRQRTGYVFRDRYKSQPIYDEKYLLNCLVYIQNNPVKAGIVDRAETYRFSSLNDYLMRSGRVDFDCAKEFFDISPQNMQTIMRESSNFDCEVEWIDIKEDNASIEDRAMKILSKYKTPPRFLTLDKEMFATVAADLSNAGLKNKDIAKIFGKSESRISRVLNASKKD